MPDTQAQELLLQMSGLNQLLGLLSGKVDLLSQNVNDHGTQLEAHALAQDVKLAAHSAATSEMIEGVKESVAALEVRVVQTESITHLIEDQNARSEERAKYMREQFSALSWKVLASIIAGLFLLLATGWFKK